MTNVLLAYTVWYGVLALANRITRHPDWYGEPQRLSPAWTVHKGDKTAECVVWSHTFGWDIASHQPIQTSAAIIARHRTAPITGCAVTKRTRCSRKDGSIAMRIDDFPDDAWICEEHPDQPSEPRRTRTASIPDEECSVGT